MPSPQKLHWKWFILPALMLAAAIILWLAPAERTLGQGIKVVYLHVALTWAGMTGLLLAGLLGLMIALIGSGHLLAWNRDIVWVSIGLFAAGLALSAVAAQVNWGGVFWAEPRTRIALNTLVIALVIQVATGWLPWLRISGALYSLLSSYLVVSTLRAPLVLHPRSPIMTSASTSIQFTFLALFALCSLAGAWLVWLLQRPRLSPHPAPSRPS